MMTYDEVKALKEGDAVGYQPKGENGPTVVGRVIQNGPRMFRGKALEHLPDVLTIQLGDGPGWMNCDPDAFPDGIAQLVKTDQPAPTLFQQDEGPALPPAQP